MQAVAAALLELTSEDYINVALLVIRKVYAFIRRQDCAFPVNLVVCDVWSQR